MSSDIPAARALLRQALRFGATGPEMRARIVEALRLMHRKRHKLVRARASLPGLTPDLADAIRHYVRAHPHVSTLDVASLFGVNPGRVSEALSGDNG